MSPDPYTFARITTPIKVTSVDEIDSPPPLPSPTLARSYTSYSLSQNNSYQHQQSQHLSISTSASQRRSSSSRQGGVQTPSIRIRHHDMGTPESIKVTKMRLELEIESPQCSPSGSYTSRSRSRSVNERSAGTPTPSEPYISFSSWHETGSYRMTLIKSGAWPSPLYGRNKYKPSLNPSPPRLSAPPMLQTPHRRPSASSYSLGLGHSYGPGSSNEQGHGRALGHSQISYEVSPHLRPQRDMYEQGDLSDDDSGSEADFGLEVQQHTYEPVPGKQQDQEQQPIEDPLDLFVATEELPIGTPGGKKADLQRGALVDGARHERGGE